MKKVEIDAREAVFDEDGSVIAISNAAANRLKEDREALQRPKPKAENPVEIKANNTDKKLIVYQRSKKTIKSANEALEIQANTNRPIRKRKTNDYRLG